MYCHFQWLTAIENEGKQKRGCDAVTAGVVREQLQATRFDIERSRCVPARKSRYAATSPGRFLLSVL